MYMYMYVPEAAGCAPRSLGDSLVCRGGATLRLFAVGPLNGSPAAAVRVRVREPAVRRAGP